MSDRQDVPDRDADRRRRKGLVLFAGGMAALILITAVGANFWFNRLQRTGAFVEASSADSPDAAAPAQAAEASVLPDDPAPHALADTAPDQTAVYAEAAMLSQTPARPAAETPAPVSPPPVSRFPDGELGKVVRQGEQIFLNTGEYAAPYVGNDLSCGNCHLDAGRKADSAPMWASFISYPAYRGKTGKVDTLASRIQGCFEYSMNGKAPAQDDAIMTALQAYMFWLAKGAPVGTTIQGSGYPELPAPPQTPDRARGAAVYAENCALCHGADGQGQRSGKTQVFPPLWGPRSFNWGAGMHRIRTAAAFIHANMPLGKGGSLSQQQAWDVALFMNSHERPQDPRYSDSVEATKNRFHAKDDSMYGQVVDGHVLGSKR